MSRITRPIRSKAATDDREHISAPDTERDTIADRLRAAERFLCFGTWEWNLDTGEVIWSPSLEAIYGLPPGTFAGHYEDFSRRVHPHDLAAVEKCRAEALAAGQAFDIEFRIIRPDGEVRWVRSQGEALRDRAGQARRIIGINVDVTEHKKVEQALALNEARLDAALKLSELLIFHQDSQLRYTWIANPAIGLRTEDLLGRTDVEIFGPECGVPLESIKRRVMRTGRSDHQEVWVTYKGTRGCFDLIVEPERSPEGVVTGVICAATNITQRKLAAEDLELQAALLERLDAGVNLVDGKGILRYTNPKFDAMFGYGTGELSGQPVSVLNDPDTAELTARSIMAALQQEDCWSGELRNRRKDGSLFWSRASTVAAHHPQHGPCWITVQSDITELRRIEAERDAACRTLSRLADHRQDEIEEQRRELAREVHDHIGATLTGVRMGLDAQLDKPDRDALLRIRSQIEELQRITRALCSQLRPPMLDDLGFAETLRWYARDWARQTGIRARVRIGSPDCEPADPLRTDLFRIAQELLTNVARHAGAQRVSIALGRARHGLTLRVRDDGRGFPPDRTEGFGLIGIRERLRRHGGRLHIDSAARGCAVTLHIPARP